MNLSVVDLGFMYNKGIINNKRIMHKSVVGNGRSLRFKDLDIGSDKREDSIVCNLDGNKYFVSDLAIKQSDTVYHSLKGNRFDADATRVLVSSMLGMGFGSGIHNTYVVSGLPISHYDTYKDEIKTLFTGTSSKSHKYDLEIEGKQVTGSTTVLKGMFVPQPFAVLMDEVLDDKGDIMHRKLANQVTAVIDCGFGTTDVYVTDGLTPIDRLTFSTSTAMNHAYGLASERMEELHRTIPLYAMESIMKTGKLTAIEGCYDVSSIVSWAIKSTADQLISEIYNKWKSVDSVGNIILAGGGGLCLSPHIKNEFPNVVLGKNGQFSVSEGYKKWGIRKWKGEL